MRCGGWCGLMQFEEESISVLQVDTLYDSDYGASFARPLGRATLFNRFKNGSGLRTGLQV